MTARERLLDAAREAGIVLTPQGEPLFARDEKAWKQLRTGLRSTCHACGASWGDCGCAPVSESQGFDAGGIWVTDPTVSECGRFFVEPAIYYGDAYLDWQARRGV